MALTGFALVHEHGGAVVEGVLVHCFDGKQLVLAFIARTAFADYFHLPPLHEEPRQPFTEAMQPPRGEYGQSYPRVDVTLDDVQRCGEKLSTFVLTVKEMAAAVRRRPSRHGTR